jgi:hypothetical protein
MLKVAEAISFDAVGCEAGGGVLFKGVTLTH